MIPVYQMIASGPGLFTGDRVTYHSKLVFPNEEDARLALPAFVKRCEDRKLLDPLQSDKVEARIAELELQAEARHAD
jgi:hypothetical protein